jgi:hypothetical protein
MHWAVFPLLVTAVSAAAVEPAVETAAAETDREGKLFSIFQIVKFNNEACDAVDGTIGTCYTASECTTKGGEERGNCASGFGVCCVAVVDPCSGAAVSLNNSYIVNPGYPGDAASGSATCTGSGVSRSGRTAGTTATYTWNITKASTDVAQIRIDFDEFEISAPMMGDCTNDTLTITGADSVTHKNLPTNLCGILSGHHIYLSVKDVDSVQLSLKIASLGTQKWKMHVKQFESSQTEYLAPRGCLQYFRQDMGTITSFNSAGGSPEFLNDHMYSICIAGNDAYCDVALSAHTFDLTGSAGACSDSITFGSNVACGSSLSFSTWNFTGPYVMSVMSDSDNSAMVTGFDIGFVLLPC